MFYCLLLLIIIMSVFLLYLNFKKMYIVNLQLMLIAYILSILSIVLYLSKDTYYYNLLKQYFYLPDFLWRKFFFLGISRFNLIRLMNLFSLLIVPLGIQFVLKLSPALPRIISRIICITSWINCLFQQLLYDPGLNLKYYYFLYPDYTNTTEYTHLQDTLYSFTRSVNVFLFLLSIVLLALAFKNAPKLKLFRLNYLYLFTGYTLIGIVYLIFISKVPAFCLNISKLSRTYTYTPIYLNDSALFYQLLAFFLGLALLILTYASWQITRLNLQMTQEELVLAKEISASETTSKIFCHYIKNELLAIEAEIEMLPVAPENRSARNALQQRCNTLYQRIDDLHRNTKTGELRLKKCIMQDILHQALMPYQKNQDIPPALQIIENYPSESIIGFVDKYYMLQALDNIFRNATDAMADLSEDRQQLILTLTTANDWIKITIHDSGVGISPENLKNVFMPFYSSHPHAQHWGIGLSLTYKIIRAHEGTIEITSSPGIGTTVTLLLPMIHQVLTPKKESKHHAGKN